MSELSLYRDPYDDGPLAIAPANELSPPLPEALFRVPVGAVERWLFTLPQAPLPLVNHYAPGLYARELQVPAGVMLTGREHLFDHYWIVSAGEVTVWGDGVEPVVLVAHEAGVGKAGARRIGYVHKPMVWTTVFPNPDELRDPDEIIARATRIPPRWEGDPQGLPFIGGMPLLSLDGCAVPEAF